MKISRATTILASAALATVLLSGCGGGAPADGGSYKTATELKDAFVKAGGKCDNWEAHNKTSLATTSGSCGDDFALGVYEDSKNLDTTTGVFKKLGISAVIGKNWVMSGVDAASAHKLLGGELIAKK